MWRKFLAQISTHKREGLKMNKISMLDRQGSCTCKILILCLLEGDSQLGSNLFRCWRQKAPLSWELLKGVFPFPDCLLLCAPSEHLAPFVLSFPCAVKAGPHHKPLPVDLNIFSLLFFTFTLQDDQSWKPKDKDEAWAFVFFCRINLIPTVCEKKTLKYYVFLLWERKQALLFKNFLSLIQDWEVQ